MGRKAHTNFSPGMKVRVKLRSGHYILGVFEDRTDTYVKLRGHKGIHHRDIVNISFQRPRGGTYVDA